MVLLWLILTFTAFHEKPTKKNLLFCFDNNCDKNCFLSEHWPLAYGFLPILNCAVKF